MKVAHLCIAACVMDTHTCLQTTDTKAWVKNSTTPVRPVGPEDYILVAISLSLPPHPNPEPRTKTGEKGGAGGGGMTWGGGVVKNVHNVLQEVQGESEQGEEILSFLPLAEVESVRRRHGEKSILDHAQYALCIQLSLIHI